MALNYRPITGQFKNFLTDTAYKYGVVNIRLIQNSYTVEAGFPAYNKDIGLDATGNLPVGLELFCNGDFIVPSAYEITEPDGVKWTFTVNYDDGTPISLQALRAGGSVPENPETVNTLIANEIAAKAVRFDIAQSLSDAEKLQARNNIGAGTGGGGGLANVVDDTTPQLGGNLDLNGFNIGGAAAAAFTLLSEITADSDEINYLMGVNDYVQDQLDEKLDHDLGGDADGDIYYRNAGVFSRLEIGAEDKVLTSKSGLPSWEAPTSGGISYTSPTTNYLPKYNGTNLVNSAVYDDGSKVVSSRTQFNIGGTAGTDVAFISRGSALVDVSAGNAASYASVGAKNFIASNSDMGQIGFCQYYPFNSSLWAGFASASQAAVIKVTDGSTGGGGLQFTERAAPTAPSTNNVILYAEDNGSGKTRLMALFPTGSAQQVAIEP